MTEKVSRNCVESEVVLAEGLQSLETTSKLIRNELFEVENEVLWYVLVIEIEKTGLEIGIGLGCIREIAQGFPIFCYVAFEKRGCVRLLFKVICDPIVSEQCFELHEISTEGGGLGVIKDGCTSLTTERHKLGGHPQGVDVLGCQSKRKGWSKVDSCGSKTRNAKTGGPRCEQRV